MNIPYLGELQIEEGSMFNDQEFISNIIPVPFFGNKLCAIALPKMNKDSKIPAQVTAAVTSLFEVDKELKLQIANEILASLRQFILDVGYLYEAPGVLDPVRPADETDLQLLMAKSAVKGHPINFRTITTAEQIWDWIEPQSIFITKKEDDVSDDVYLVVHLYTVWNDGVFQFTLRNGVELVFVGQPDNRVTDYDLEQYKNRFTENNAYTTEVGWVNNRSIRYNLLRSKSNLSTNDLLPNAGKWSLVIMTRTESIVTNDIIDLVMAALHKNVLYISVIGPQAHLVEEICDETIAGRRLDQETAESPESSMAEVGLMTTAHTDVAEGIWFAVTTANHEHETIDTVIILDLGIDDDYIYFRELLYKIANEG